MSGQEQHPVKTLKVTHHSGKCFTIDDGRHKVLSDQPVSAKGEDLGPTPVELFIGAMAACTAVYAQSYINRHELPMVGDLGVTAEWQMASAPGRVARVALTIDGTGELTEEQSAALIAFSQHCTIHNTIHNPPAIEVGLPKSGPESRDLDHENGEDDA